MHTLMEVATNNRLRITAEDLRRNFVLKHGALETTGWAPRRRLRFGYHPPADHYETLINKLVTEYTDWIDVGGGGALFPNNETLARVLSERARRLVGVDPSDNIDTNSFLHEHVKCRIQEYKTNEQFDLATLRMVAEHIMYPTSVIRALNRLLRHSGVVVVFTVNRWSPVTMVSRLLPFALHHPVKKIFWGSEEKDTFPTVYKMNTRKHLKKLFADNGFEEKLFAYLDDLSVFGRFKLLNYAELFMWQILKGLRLSYLENCLLGVYEKIHDAP